VPSHPFPLIYTLRSPFFPSSPLAFFFFSFSPHSPFALRPPLLLSFPPRPASPSFPLIPLSPCALLSPPQSPLAPRSPLSPSFPFRPASSHPPQLPHSNIPHPPFFSLTPHSSRTQAHSRILRLSLTLAHPNAFPHLPRTPHSAHCTLHTTHHTLHTAQRTLHIAQCHRPSAKCLAAALDLEEEWSRLAAQLTL
jgi:hypothetical protein